MAKFKLGDKVTDGNAVYEITGIDNGFGSYEWKLISGRADPSHSEGGDFGWADAKMKIANSAPVSANPVVQKAMNAVHETMYMGKKVKVIGRMMCGDDSLIGKEGVIDKIDPAGAYHLKGFDNDVWFKQSSLETVNACGTARNGSLGEDAALGISYAREAVAKLNSAVPLIEKWIASGKGHPNAVADGKRLVNGIKKAVAILNPVV